MIKKIPIIDLFAGPGGLGEGFMSVKDKSGESVFDIKLSIEKDKDAHKTLTWRSFFRQFVKVNKKVPEEYYDAIREPILSKREQIIEETLDNYEEGRVAREEARLVELGSKKWSSEQVDELIRSKLEGAQKWVLIGGPPCQAYSNVGRSRVGGIDKDDHRVYLYQEYLRIIKKHKPAIFVMENVQGLLSASVEGEKVFDWMKRDLTDGDNYTIHSLVRPVEKDSDYLIKSENYGVPQMRHRVILLGVRKDYSHQKEYLERKETVSLEAVVEGLPPVRSGLNRRFTQHDKVNRGATGKPNRLYSNVEDSDENWITLFKENAEKIKGWGEFKGFSKPIERAELQTGSEFIPNTDSTAPPKALKDWYLDNRLNGVANHQSRAHLTQDLLDQDLSSQ